MKIANDAVWEIKTTMQVFIHKKNKKHPFNSISLRYFKDKVFTFQSLCKRLTVISPNMKNVFQEAFTFFYHFVFN